MGKLLERAVNRSALTTLEVAEILKINRRTLYNLFNKNVIRQETVILVNQALVSKVVERNNSIVQNNEAPPTIDTDPDWKNKYIHLIQDYAEMIDEDHEEAKSN